MLCALAYLGELELVDAVAEEFVDGESEGALEGCRGRKAGAERDVTCEHGVEAFHLATPLEGLAAHSEDISCPGLDGGILLFETEFHKLVIVKGIGTDFLLSVEPYLCEDSAVDGAGEHIAAVVVGVFADEVDAAGRCEEAAVSAVKCPEFFLDLGFHCCMVLVYNQCVLQI